MSSRSESLVSAGALAVPAASMLSLMRRRNADMGVNGHGEAVLGENRSRDMSTVDCGVQGMADMGWAQLCGSAAQVASVEGLPGVSKPPDIKSSPVLEKRGRSGVRTLGFDVIDCREVRGTDAASVAPPDDNLHNQPAITCAVFGNLQWLKANRGNGTA